MISYRLRPRFEQTIASKPDAIQDSISRYFTNEFEAFEVKRFPGFTCIRIPKADRHFWSPRLNLSFDTEMDEESTTLIHGYYGPNANVWSLLLYGYLILGSLALFGGIYAIAQSVLGNETWSTWVFAGALGGSILLYLIARMGRRIGERQVLRLHRAYEAAIGEKVAIR